MKKILSLDISLLIAIIFILACDSCNTASTYGKKIVVNEKSEVYYKGTHITEVEAIKLGDFLSRNTYFDTKIPITVQVFNTKDTFTVNFVVDPQRVSQRPNSEASYSAMQVLIQDSVFNGRPTRVSLANENLEVIKKLSPL